MASIKDTALFDPYPTEVAGLFVGNVTPADLQRISEENDRVQEIEDEDEKADASAKLLLSMFENSMFVGEDGTGFTDVDLKRCRDMGFVAQQRLANAMLQCMSEMGKKQQAIQQGG